MPEMSWISTGMIYLNAVLEQVVSPIEHWQIGGSVT
jgi:hypothetical protein